MGTRVLIDHYGTSNGLRPGLTRRSSDRSGSESRAAVDSTSSPGNRRSRNDPSWPGEWATIVLLKRAARLLTIFMRYDVPAQDGRSDLSHLPTLLNSCFVITNVSRLYARPLGHLS